MTFQLKRLAIYSRGGERRTLDFKLGAVNVITGASQTGKSALIQIIEYCLGRTDFDLPAGIISETVSWFAIQIVNASGEAIIARPVPTEGYSSNSEAMYLRGSRLELPEFAELKKTTNTHGLEKFLNEFTGIRENINIPKEGQSRDPLTANIAHARILLFQPQDRIAVKTMLFHRQEDSFIAQSIKDTLPYFLGAASDDRVDKLQKLRLARRELKLLEQKIASEADITGKDDSRALSLLAEAQSFGLVSQQVDMSQPEVVMSALRDCLTWTPEIPANDLNAKVDSLRVERDSFQDRIAELTGEVEAARAFAMDQKGFSNEVKEQKNRLESIGLFADSTTDECPLCRNQVNDVLPSIQDIRASLSKIDSQIEAVIRERPRLEQYISGRELEIAKLRGSLFLNKQQLEAIFIQEEELREQRLTTTKQARIVGRISLFLDSYKSQRTENHESLLERRKREVLRLEKEVSAESIDSNVAGITRVIGTDMTKWAQTLNVEHSEVAVELDVKNLTVVAFTKKGEVPLKKLGSAENWLGCHLIAHLGLHKWFVENDRPVPRILIFDQPTQVYFANYEDIDEDDPGIEDLSDDDRYRVERMFKFIFGVVEELTPKMQLIITDHADLKIPWFQNAVVEKWRKGLKLIPNDWNPHLQ